jgi:CHASE2 domain-containing sensor protein
VKVFISYRRDDSALAAKLLHNELARHFGADNVFMDIEDIGYGDDLVAAIDSHLAGADVVVVVIGPRWLELLQARLRGDDWVREEVRRSLALRASTGTGRPRVIAALVEGAKVPVDGLPEDLQLLRSSNMLRIDARALNQSLNTLAEAVQGRPFASIADEMQRRRRAQMAAVAAGTVVFLAGWVSLFDLLGLDTRAATATMRLSSALPGAEAPWGGTVVLASVDEKTVAAVGRPFGPAWRAEHAQFVLRAAEAGALTVGFDLTFDADGPDAADAALAGALASVGGRMPVVVGVQEVDGSLPRIAPRLAALVQWGIACAGERLGLARSMPLLVERKVAGEKPAGQPAAPAEAEPMAWPSLALAAFSIGGKADPLSEVQQRQQRVTVVRGANRRSAELPFHAFEQVTRAQRECPAIQKGDRVASQLFDPGALPALDRPPQRIAYEDVLRGEPQALAALSGRIVLVGVQLADQDSFEISGGRKRWGSAIVPLPAVAQVLMAIAMALLGALAAAHLSRRPRAVRLLAVAALGAGFIAAAVLLYRSEQLLLGIPYGLVALALGAWLGGRFSSKGLR